MRRNRFVLGVAALSAGLAGAALLPLGPLQVFELQTLDLRFRLRELWARRANPPTVVTVAVDDESLAATGLGPWPFGAYADAIEHLRASDVTTLGLDLDWAPVDTTALQLGADYRRLRVVVAAGNATVVAGGRFDAARQADVALERDQDGVVRRMPLVVRAADGFTPTFALAVACEHLGIAPGDVQVQLGHQIDLARVRRIPIDAQGRMLVNYRKQNGADLALSTVAAGRFKRDAVAGHPVLLGTTSRAAGRSYSTPLTPQAAEVHVLGAAVETILSGRFLQPAPRLLQFVINWLFLLAGALWMTRLTPLRGVGMGLALMVAYFVTEKIAFVWQGAWLDFVGPIAALQIATLVCPLYTYRNRNRALVAEMARLGRLDDLILSSTTSGLLVADFDGRILKANLRAAQLLGCDEAALPGQSLQDLFARSPVALATIDEVRRRQEATDAESACVRPVHVAALVESHDEAVPDRIFDLSVAALDDQSSEPGMARCYLLTFTDITERVRVAQEDERRARLAAIGEIAARLGHEIRNSLGGLRLYVENVREEIDPHGDAGRAIDCMVDEIESLYRKIDELREYARDPILEMSDCDLQQVVDEALAFAGQRIRDKQIQLRIESEPHLAPVQADRRQIRDAFQNLINNAIEAAPAGGHLRIVVERSTNGIAPVGHYMVHFEDDGAGIPAEIGEQVFSLFFTTKADAGTGLGLPIVRKIVESHGGRVSFKSEVGAGTRFTVVLPPGRRGEEPE